MKYTRIQDASDTATVASAAAVAAVDNSKTGCCLCCCDFLDNLAWFFECFADQ